MKDKAAISVIIPVYNSERFLRECLDSIVGQTLPDLEIICVNDGSTDNSLQILNEYARNDSRVKIVTRENGGMSQARNSGLAVATGEYISFIDSDDFVESTMLEKLYAKAQANDADIAVCDFWLYYVDIEKLDTFRNEILYTVLSNKVFSISDFPYFIGCVAVWDRIYKADFLKRIDVLFPENLVYEDHLFTFQCICQAARVVLVNERLYFYRKNAGNSITDKETVNAAYKFDYLTITRMSKEFLKDSGMYETVKKHYLSFQFTYALLHQRNIMQRKVFLDFFRQMRELTPDDECDLMMCDENAYLAKYAQLLKAGDAAGCWRHYSLRRHFRRRNGHLYFRPFLGGGEIKLMKSK